MTNDFVAYTPIPRFAVRGRTLNPEWDQLLAQITNAPGGFAVVRSTFPDPPKKYIMKAKLAFRRRDVLVRGKKVGEHTAALWLIENEITTEQDTEPNS